MVRARIGLPLGIVGIVTVAYREPYCRVGMSISILCSFMLLFGVTSTVYGRVSS